jgi:hypothetical protein
MFTGIEMDCADRAVAAILHRSDDFASRDARWAYGM